MCVCGLEKIIAINGPIGAFSPGLVDSIPLDSGSEMGVSMHSTRALLSSVYMWYDMVWLIQIHFAFFSAFF